MDHTLFIHSFISGHLGCLELVATVNNAAMNVGVQISVHVPTSDFVYILPEMACLPLDAHVPFFPSFFLLLLLLSRFSHVQLWETPWTAVYQAPLSTEFSRQEYRSGLPFPSP